MKKVTKFFMAALLTGICSLGYGQTQPDYKNAPKSDEKVLGVVSVVSDETDGWSDKLEKILYLSLFEKAKKEFPNRSIDIREMEHRTYSVRDNPRDHWYYYRFEAIGKVVYRITPEAQTKENLSQVLNKALCNVREGSRLAIDQVTVISSMDRETLKDQLIDVLLDKGYKVVAKEYLEKLYEEQQAQQSGIYNDRTTVQENNFSAVGYYINVKVTEASLRVQVVNVSTGEYEGNATVNF